MASSGPDWRKGASDLGHTITRSSRPVTFLVGAGASLSSGAPTTAAVSQAFEKATTGRFAGVDPKDLLHTLAEPDKQDILAPLFAGVAPYIGYRCIAALGRHRRVRVLNLNWDNALTEACRELGVRHTVFDLSDGSERQLIEDTDDPGVDIAHVHGRIGHECRYEVLRTLSFNESEERFLSRYFLLNTLVVAGASVVNDTDLQALFLEKRERPSSSGDGQPGQWYFGRPDDGPQADAIRRAHLPRGVLNYFSVEDVDFDELMVRVLGPVLNADWELVRNYRPSIALPALDRLVWPRPALLRPLLGKRTIALLGQARLGKTVLAHFIAYLNALWQARQPWLESDIPVREVDGPSDAVAALSGVIDAEARSYVIENPFGIGGFADDNPPFVQALARLDALHDRKATVIVTSRLSAWQAASGTIDGYVAGSSSSPSDWYSEEALRAYARKIAPERRDVLDQIGPQGIRTPAKLQDSLAGIPFAAGSSSGDETEVADKLALLEKDETLAWFCCILRLQEFSQDLLPREDIEALLGSPLDGLSLHEVVSHKFEYDGSQRWRLLHDTDREAANIYIARHESEISRRIPETSAVGQRIGRAFNEWKLIADASAGRWEGVRAAPAPALRAYAPDLLKVPQIDAETVDLLSDQRYDAWELKDLSYEVVRVWNMLGETAAGRRLLGRILSDHAASGTYALLEACLYMQQSASDELWRKVYGSLDDAVLDPAHAGQVALAVDALTWRPPPEPYRHPSWARKFIHSLSPDQPRWALVRFLAGYHGGGLSLLEMDALIEKDSTHGWTADQADFASWLIRWHFVHQSRARAQFARQPWVDKDFLCRSLHLQPKDQAHSGMNRLLRSFLDHPVQAGWGFFLGCNVAAVGHGIDPEGASLTLRNLEIARPSSDGVIAAALTYMTANRYAHRLKGFFASDENREALLDAMRDGLIVDGLRLAPPRFIVNRDAASCYLDTGLDWGNLKAALASDLPPAPSGQLDVRGLIMMLKARVDGMPPRQREGAMEVLQRAATGDLRLLDAAAAARSHDSISAVVRPDALLGLLNRAASLLAAERQTLL